MSNNTSIRLLRDLVIPAGTVISPTAPGERKFYTDRHELILGVGKDECAYLTFLHEPNNKQDLYEVIDELPEHENFSMSVSDPALDPAYKGEPVPIPMGASDQQIMQLTNFLLENYGDQVGDEGAVGLAIRLLTPSDFDNDDKPVCFGIAIEAAKQGRRITRVGWNGQGMFVYMAPAASYPVQTGAAKAHFGEGSLVPYRAYLALKTVDEDVATWQPSTSDALAEDWLILPEA